MVYRRFAILHASVLLEESPSWWEVAVAVSMIDRVLVQRNTDDEGSIGMHQIASGEPQDRSVLLRFLQQEFAEYCKQKILLWISLRSKSDCGFCNSRFHISGTQLPP